MTKRFESGGSVRIDTPDEIDPDYERLHGRHGVIVEIISDGAGAMICDEREGCVYVDKLDNREITDVRWRDLRPV